MVGLGGRQSVTEGRDALSLALLEGLGCGHVAQAPSVAAV